MAKIGFIIAVVLAVMLFPAGLPAEEDTPPSAIEAASPPLDQLHLSEAVICETLEAFKPLNSSVIFPVSVGSIMCFTGFDHVPELTSIFHDWIRRDRLVFRKKLVLKTPRWSSVSSIQLREADKGPWRVEVRDADGNLIRILRFSITD